MERYIKTREAAQRWGISSRRVNILCKSGRIPGAYKEGKQWFIPADAKKPADQRLKNDRPAVNYASIGYTDAGIYTAADLGTLLREGTPGKKLPLPIGVSDYRKASTQYYYVDKTLLIRDFIDERPQVSLFTRPRRFGKTLNMDMLRVFFEISDEDTSVYFRDKKIWACGRAYQIHQGKYPVIYVTFKDVKCETWEAACDLISKILRNEFERHRELLQSGRISAYEKKYMEGILNGEGNENDFGMAFLNLSRMLHVHYGIAPIIIIDEYDTPIQQGHMKGYYDEVIRFMRTLFSGGLKDNPHLSYGFLTGILRVAKESIFSGLNNLKINSVLDRRYSEYFGFTADEVRSMAAYYGAADKYQEICQWYNGYRFGDTDIFNPWSVIGYFNNECEPRAFWQSTGSNDIVGEILASATKETMARLESLMKGQSFVTHIDTSVIYPQIQNNPSSIYSFLLVTGYLKAVARDQTFGGDYMCEVAVPNKEISYVYSKEILSRLESVIPASAAIAIQEAVYTMDIPELQKRLADFLVQTISFHDAASEAFYHGLVLGLCAMLDSRYRITSNREAGKGRFDIQLFPLYEKLPGILLELKSGKDCTEQQLSALAKKALRQINARQYDAQLKAGGVKTLLKYGIAFCGKDVCIEAEVFHVLPESLHEN